MKLDIRLRKYWRVIYDDESEKWGYISRTFQIGLGQAPAVYGYSPEPNPKPDGYRVLETDLENAYYELNDFDINGNRDGLGVDRCQNFLFKDDTALYNNTRFPRRELLTMSGNLLSALDVVAFNNLQYLKFRTLARGDDVTGLTYANRPDLVHRFEIVQYRDNQTLTVPKVNRNGYLYYYLITDNGIGYMPIETVRPLK